MQLKKQFTGSYCEKCDTVTRGIYNCSCGWVKKEREEKKEKGEENE